MVLLIILLVDFVLSRMVEIVCFNSFICLSIVLNDIV